MAIATHPSLCAGNQEGRKTVEDLYKKAMSRRMVSDLEDRVAESSGMSLAHPLLHELMTRSKYKGKDVKTCTLLLWAEDGRWKARLRSREAQECLWITMDDPLDLFDAIEANLASGEAEWRKDRFNGRP